MEQTVSVGGHLEANEGTEFEDVEDKRVELECVVGAPRASLDAAPSGTELAARWLPVGSACASPCGQLFEGQGAAVFLHRGSGSVVGAQAPPSQGMFDDRFDHTEDQTDGADESRSSPKRSRANH